jgi:hypothetical protein
VSPWHSVGSRDFEISLLSEEFHGECRIGLPSKELLELAVHATTKMRRRRRKKMTMIVQESWRLASELLSSWKLLNPISHETMGQRNDSECLVESYLLELLRMKRRRMLTLTTKMRTWRMTKTSTLKKIPHFCSCL